MNRRELKGLGVPDAAIGATQAGCRAAARSGIKKRGIRALLGRLVAAPDEFFEDEFFAAAARALIDSRMARDRFAARPED